MRKFLDRLFPSLGKKVAITVVAGLVIAWSVFVFFAQRTGFEILEKESQAKAHAVADLTAGILRHVVQGGDETQIHDVLRLVTATPDIVDAFLVAADGTIIWHVKTDAAVASFPLEQFRDIGLPGGDKFLPLREEESVYEIVLRPIQMPRPPSDSSGRKEFRYVALKISMADVRTIAIDHRTANVVTSVAIFTGLGVLLYLVLIYLVVRPIRRVHSHIGTVETDVRKLELGEKINFPRLPVETTHDEIGELSRGLNSLIDRLNDANAKLIEMHHIQLEHVDRLAATGEMAASMAHEIKNPVAGVLGVLQVFESEAQDNSEKKELLTEMMLQLERVNHAVNDLLHYARPTQPVFEQTELHPLIEKTVSILSRQWKGHHVNILTELSPTPVVLAADKKQLQQVFWNVILNALQAIPEAGSITIRTVILDDAAVITVADSGKGLTPEETERVFKPFFTTKHKGTGLGMTISRRIVEQHHGTIAVASAPGQGTTVTIRLPRNIPNISNIIEGA
jgi:signal transduction histidine kinase